MKNKNYHNVGTVPKSNLKIVERDKVYTPYPLYMTVGVHSHGLVQALQ